MILKFIAEKLKDINNTVLGGNAKELLKIFMSGFGLFCQLPINPLNVRIPARSLIKARNIL